MWREVFRLAAATELGLVVIEELFHPSWLPMAGGQFKQISVLFIAAFVVLEGLDALRSLRR